MITKAVIKPALLVLLCLPMCAVAADAQPSLSSLQKLFTTPYERAQLDAQRRRGGQPQQPGDAAQKAPLPPIEVELKGVVKREGGPDVVWVNKQNTLESSIIDERIRVRTGKISSTFQVPMRVDSKTIRLKPGQVWDEAERTIRDKYQTKRSEKQATGMDEAGTSTDN